MATAPALPQLISIDDYFAGSFAPDVEFVDGALEQRTAVEWDHGFLLAALAAWFCDHRAEWKVDALIGYWTRTSETRVRLPDICVVRQDAPVERVGVTAPLLCVEILSPEDRPGRVMRRLDDFVAMGVEHLWIVDPMDRSASTYTRAGMKPVEGTRLEIAGTGIWLDVGEMFGLLDGR